MIHIEQQWEENVLTVKGSLFHERVHDGYSREKKCDYLSGNASAYRGIGDQRDMRHGGICPGISHW